MAAVLACGPPIGATPTDPVSVSPPSQDPMSPWPSEVVDAEPSATVATATTSPAETDADLAGRLEGARNGDAVCAWLLDDEGDRWTIKWRDGHRIRWDDDRVVLDSPSGTQIASSGDRLGLQGYAGWFVDDQISVKFDVDVLDPVAAEQGEASPRRTVLESWATAHGLEVLSGARDIGWWRLLILDGTREREKAAALRTLPEVRKAIAILLGAYVMGEPISSCPSDGRFTAESVTFVEFT